MRISDWSSDVCSSDLVDPAALDALIETYETRVGPHNGAHVVAKAWSDPGYHAWLMQDATAAIHSLGYTGRQGEHMVAVENTPAVHNMVVCTLCSCYPWRSEEHTSELQSLMRISYAVFCLKKKKLNAREALTTHTNTKST